MPTVPSLPRRQPLYNAEDRKGAYVWFASKSFYFHDSGMIQMPLAGSATQSAQAVIGRLHAPVSQRVFVWTVGRRGALPTLPHPDDADEGEVLAEIAFCALDPDPDPTTGTLVFGFEGSYLYLLREAVDQDNPGGSVPLRMGRPPHLGISASALAYRRQQFQRGIL